MIKDQERSDIGRYAGWRSGDENARPGPADDTGPGMIPFLRQRANERWWQVGLGFAYVPAIIVVVTVESWLKVDQPVIWISLGLFYVAFVAFVYVTARKTR